MATMGEKIKAARKVTGMTQKQLAEAAGCPALAVSFYETDRHRPEPERLARIAEALWVTVEELEPDPEAPAPEHGAGVRVTTLPDGQYVMTPEQDGLAVELGDTPPAADMAEEQRRFLISNALAYDPLAAGADAVQVQRLARFLAKLQADAQRRLVDAFMVIVNTAPATETEAPAETEADAPAETDPAVG